MAELLLQPDEVAVAPDDRVLLVLELGTVRLRVHLLSAPNPPHSGHQLLHTKESESSGRTVGVY